MAKHMGQIFPWNGCMWHFGHSRYRNKIPEEKVNVSWLFCSPSGPPHACLRRARHPLWLPWHWLTLSCVGCISLHWPWRNASACLVFPINLANRNRGLLGGQEFWKKTWSENKRKESTHVYWHGELLFRTAERWKGEIKVCGEEREGREVWREGRQLEHEQ